MLTPLYEAFPARATTIYDLDNRKTTHIDDGIPDGKIIRDGKEIVFFMLDTGMKPGTTPMSNADYRYAIDRFNLAVKAEQLLDESKRGTSTIRNSQTAKTGSHHNNCPPGKRQYQKTALFGLIKGEKLCLSDFEAESLRSQQRREIQDGIQRIQQQQREEWRDLQERTRLSYPRLINCTSRVYGNYVSTSCF